MVRAGKTDPATSHLAASEAEAGGRARAQRRLCLAEVLKSPGKTAAEIAAATGLERHAPSRRLPELREAGLIANGRSRICTVTDRLSIMRFPVAASAQAPTGGQEVQP